MTPVIQHRPALFPGDDFRDPFVWKDEQNNKWNMIIGTGINTPQGVVGGLFLYKSDDLFEWEFVDQPFFLGNPEIMGGRKVGVFWEMPILVFANGKAILVVNRTPQNDLPADVLYWIGEVIDDVFVPDDVMPKTLELLICELAPTIVIDELGRLVSIAVSPDTWIAFKQDWLAHKELGWANIMSLPKVWTLDENTQKIIRTPHPNLRKLRTRPIVVENMDLFNNQSTYLSNSIQGLQLEVIGVFQPSPQISELGLVLLRSPDDSEQTNIYYDYNNQQIVVDRSRSSLNPNAVTDVTTGPYNLPRNQDITFHVFLDHSSIEVFINEKDAFSTRVFTTKEDSNIVDFHVKGDGAKLVSLNVWEMLSSDDLLHVQHDEDVVHVE
eukprot:TRINITY_DN25679_c1_g3_i5.p1 TRINITY_DN25679_c1_g3~~TRINITY_DN25679_c1_g3_i5.p1  ORF type:complete len:424 (-),score=53.10 TRINITY_DN25679_c1_g3_i5:294-1436(-)